VKFKIGENLPAEAAETLSQSGFVADTVADENLSGSDDETVVARSRSEKRILMTLDLDFANIRAYPPGEHSGIIVLRLKRQDKATAMSGGWPRHSRIEARWASCGSLMVIGYAFRRVTDRPWPTCGE
jgi:predicted nuclease of predicted toxin-antitoxin system